MARKVQRTKESKGKRRTQQKQIRTSGFMSSNATQKTDFKANIIRVIKRIKEFMDKNIGVLTILEQIECVGVICTLRGRLRLPGRKLCAFHPGSVGEMTQEPAEVICQSKTIFFH